MSIAELINTIRREGCFELYCHAHGREDLNDSNKAYARAESRVNYSFLHGKEYHSLEMGLREYYGAGATPKDDFEVVIYGKFPGEIPLSKSGLFGRLLKKVNTREIQIGDLVDGTNNEENAYFIRLDIRADIPDSFGRRAESNPCLTIVADKGKILNFIDYLQKNPADYYNVIRQFLPEKQYPNVNSKIIKQAQPGRRLLFLYMDYVCGHLNEIPTFEEMAKKEGISIDKGMSGLEDAGKIIDECRPGGRISESPAVRKKFGVFVCK